MIVSSRPSELFAGRLRAARQCRKLSQGALAKRSGLQPSAISHFETTGRRPSLENLRRLADALSVTTDYLLARTTDMQGTSAHPDSLHRHYAGLSAELQEVVEDFARMLAEKSQRTKEGFARPSCNPDLLVGAHDGPTAFEVFAEGRLKALPAGEAAAIDETGGGVRE